MAMLIAEQNVAFLDLADRVLTLEGRQHPFRRDGGSVERRRRAAPGVFRAGVNGDVDRVFVGADHAAIAIGGRTVVAATWNATDLRQIVAMLSDLLAGQREILATLHEQTRILNDHTRTLDEHTRILNREYDAVTGIPKGTASPA